VVTRGEDGGHDHSIYEAPRDIRPHHLKHQRKRRSRRVLCRQARGGIRDIQTDDEDGDDVEEEDAPEDVFDDAGDVFVRGRRLAGGDGDGFCAAVGEGGGYEDGGETADAADEGGAGETPVFAADVVVGGVAAGVDGDAEEDEDLGGVSAGLYSVV
jgi:hypothetical protein